MIWTDTNEELQQFLRPLNTPYISLTHIPKTPQISRFHNTQKNSYNHTLDTRYTKNPRTFTNIYTDPQTIHDKEICTN